DPSEGYKDGLDAFSRLIKCAGIRTQSLPDIGLFADRFDQFEKNDCTRALVPEWIARQWRRASLGLSSRAVYVSDDNALNPLMGPYADAAQIRTTKQLAPAIPLSTLVAMTTPIDTDAYRAYYLQDDASQQRMVRVAEGGEIPKAKLVGSDRTIPLYK